MKDSVTTMCLSKKRKVLFFLPSNTGGAERMTITIAKMLPKESFEVKFVIVHRTKGTIIKFIPEEYEILHVPIRNIWCLTTIRMMIVIKKENPDIVFSSMFYLNVRLIIAARLCKTKVVVRNNLDLSKNKTFIIWLVKLVYPFVDYVITQQEEMRDEMIRMTMVSPHKVVVLHNPIDKKTLISKNCTISPYPNGELQIKYVWVGRFNYVKGQDLIVRAFKIVKEKSPQANLYLIGDFDLARKYDREVYNYVIDNNLIESVHFVGFEDNPYKWVKHADCFVLPSRREGLPNSLIEAMYLGKPVVATKCIPVIERIVQDGYNGVLALSGNYISIAQAMLKALSLKNFTMTYTPSSESDFVRIFKDL